LGAFGRSAIEPRPQPDDVVRFPFGDREIVLVGTAHVSKESEDLVRRVIEEDRPDRVCVELDAQRYEALTDRSRWENLDLREILRKRQMSTLLLNLLLASYQRRLGAKLGMLPGAELLAATETAKRLGIPFELSDRPIRITMLRAWRTMSFWEQCKLLAAILEGALGGGGEIDENALRELRRSDVLSEAMNELASYLPRLKTVLIDERDRYMAQSIAQSVGRRVVAVVGAGHLLGIRRALEIEGGVDLVELSRIPPPSKVGKVFAWGIPVTILGALAWIAFTKGSAVAGQSLLAWILAAGIPSAIGAALALAHPLTILAAFVAAPFTTLSPAIGAGHVTALVQAWAQPPRVRDFHTVIDEAGKLPAWWRNRLLKVLLAFLFPSIGAAIGLWIGGAEIVRNLF